MCPNKNTSYLYTMSLFEKLQEAKAQKIAATKALGEAFLTENATLEGVVTLASGMQYKVITQSENTQKPKPYSKVTCHYHGTLINGEVFDSSVKRNQTATFPLDKVIKGWQEGVLLMTLGSKFVFYIPSHLAYGDEQMGAKIAPGSTLVFEVELLGIN
jgi:FKBP-type peptidyl-prolyl cis-trans isomerase FklB